MTHSHRRFHKPSETPLSFPVAERFKPKPVPDQASTEPKQGGFVAQMRPTGMGALVIAECQTVLRTFETRYTDAFTRAQGQPSAEAAKEAFEQLMQRAKESAYEPSVMALLRGLEQRSRVFAGDAPEATTWLNQSRQILERVRHDGTKNEQMIAECLQQAFAKVSPDKAVSSR